METCIGESFLKQGQVLSFVCVDSPLSVAYRTLEEQRKSNHLEIVNEAFETCSVSIKQESSKLSLEMSLDPGASFSFEGRNPAQRKIFKSESNFDATYDVTVKRGGTELPAELSVGQLLRIEGGEMS